MECIPTKSVNVLNSQGRLAAMLRADDVGTRLVLLDPDGEVRVQIVAEAAGGRIELLDASGTLTMFGTNVVL